VIVIPLIKYSEKFISATNISAQNISATKERFINPIFMGRASNILMPILLLLLITNNNRHQQ
jgi:hypothetical protein